MTASQVRGLVLAAGLGTRLRPLTDVVPKPLLPLAGVPLLYLALWRLKAAGIEHVAVNSHYLADLTAKAVNSCPFSLDLYLTREPTILGTGGPLMALSPWRGEADVLIYNGDIVSDIDLAALLAQHQASKAVATMVLLPTAVAGKNPVYSTGFGPEASVVAIGGDGAGFVPRTFTGVHVVTKRFLSDLPASGPSDIISAYRQAFLRGERVGAYFHHGYWQDLGAPDTYASAHWDLLGTNCGQSWSPLVASLGVQALLGFMGQSPRLIPSRQTLCVGELEMGSHAEVGPRVVSSGRVRIGKNAKVSDAVLLDGAVIGEGEVVSRAIITSTHRVPVA